MTTEEKISKIKENVFQEIKTASELNSLLGSMKNADSEQEKKMIESQTEKMKIFLRKTNEELLKNLDSIIFSAPLKKSEEIKLKEIPPKKIIKTEKLSPKMQDELSELDLEIIKRLKKEKEKKEEKKEEKKTGEYAKFANNIFSKLSVSLIKKGNFKTVSRDLIQAKLEYNIISYVSIILLNTSIAFGLSFFLFLVLLFFNISPTIPIITRATENIFLRLVKVIWIPIIATAGTFAFMRFYPSLEKKSLGGKVDAELPFAAIHMAAISGSLIDPTKIFSIIASTKEYPYLEKEFNKLLNEINVYGYDLVTALKDSALNSPSAKLSELLNGLATTITSGGNLYEFFEKRSQSLLFEYRLDKEKGTKAAETFMDIYISVVIAAPMIFMLLLMMMKISGIGISLSTTTITLLVVGAVSLVNVFFLMFLQVKQKSTA